MKRFVQWRIGVLIWPESRKNKNSLPKRSTTKRLSTYVRAVDVQTVIPPYTMEEIAGVKTINAILTASK
jgi:hypothetical protein